jgi:hypothetical protein
MTKCRRFANLSSPEEPLLQLLRTWLEPDAETQNAEL